MVRLLVTSLLRARVTFNLEITKFFISAEDVSFDSHRNVKILTSEV